MEGGARRGLSHEETCRKGEGKGWREPMEKRRGTSATLYLAGSNAVDGERVIPPRQIDARAERAMAHSTPAKTRVNRRACRFGRTSKSSPPSPSTSRAV